MGKKTIYFLVRNENGQSLVEYVLLFGVVLVLTFSVLQSDRFKDFFGEDSEVMQSLRKRMMYSYRHGTFGEEDVTDYNSGAHDTFKMPGDNQSRFFSPIVEYP